jgi:hypothetical protein
MAPQHSARSSQMVRCLCEGFIYCQKRARDLLFTATESIVNTSDNTSMPVIVAKLTRQAAISARQAAQLAGYEFSNWDVASKALINAMIQAGVLLTNDGAPVPVGVTARASEVVGLREEYRDRTEAYMIEFLIRKLGDVTTRDHKALAHALFRQFDPSVSMDDFEDRVVVLLARLADRVTLDENGVYAIVSHVPHLEFG